MSDKIIKGEYDISDITCLISWKNMSESVRTV